LHTLKYGNIFPAGNLVLFMKEFALFDSNALMDSFYMRKLVIIILALTVQLFTACEKFTSYDYESEKIGSRSVIHGQVKNIFNFESVSGASIKIGVLDTRTDENGRYSVEYILGVDEERNKPLEIRVDAQNYYPIDTSLILFPPDMQFDLKMVYAAPMIKSAWSGVVPVLISISPDPFLTPVTQIQLNDYQGIATVDSVISIFYYAKQGDAELRKVPVLMQQDSILSTTSAFYHAVGPPHIDVDYRYYDRTLEIYAADNEGYHTRITLDDSEIFVDNPLFPVQIDP
jgi:hypothetical protein